MELINGLEIISFFKEGNTYNFSDPYLGQVFRTIVMEGSAHRVFYDGSVKNTIEFIDFVKRKDVSVFFVKFKDEDVGVFWLSTFIQKSVFINYCFYKAFWGKESLKISQACLDYILHEKNAYGEYLVDVLLGLTPANNKLAISFLQKNGMTVLGKIPDLIADCHYNKTVDGVLSYKTRGKSQKRISSVFNLFSLL